MLLLVPKYLHFTFAARMGVKDGLRMKQRKEHYRNLFLSLISTKLVLWRRDCIRAYRAGQFTSQEGIPNLHSRFAFNSIHERAILMYMWQVCGTEEMHTGV
jgi:hypothetical protein